MIGTKLSLYGKRIRIAGEVRVDSFTQQRVLELRKEIATLQRDNESYRRRTRHAESEFHTNELRRLRLVAIKEELLRLSTRSKRTRNAASSDNMPARMQSKFWDECGRKEGVNKTV